MITASKRRAIRLLRLAQQIGPTGAVVAATGLLIGELADDLSVQLSGFRRAYLALGGKGERRVLLVLGREPSVPGEASHHGFLSSELHGGGQYARTVTAKEKLLREVLELDEARAARARIVVPDEPEMAALPAGWGETLTGEPMPNVAAAVRRSRESH